MLSEFDVLCDVAKRLSQAKIPYMLMGSFALNYYAAPRMTRDIDSVVAPESNDADRIVALFEGEY